MKNKNKIIFALLLLAVVVSFSQKIKKYIFDKDYFVYMNPVCIQGYSCFTNEDAEEPYLKVYRKAYKVQQCIELQNCQPDFCEAEEQDCMVVTCSEDSLEEGEICTEIK
ncbi:MAG: hypothetical protein RLZZ517_131 [Candidatus Parcubacteria bacterium]|jgi:hypothetical protein